MFFLLSVLGLGHEEGLSRNEGTTRPLQAFPMDDYLLDSSSQELTHW